MAAASSLREEAGPGPQPVPSSPLASSPPAAAPQRLIPGSSPSAPARPSAPNAPSAHVSPGPPAARPAPTGPAAPLSRPGGFSGTRPAGGPLSAHTTHRGAAPRPAGPGHPAPAQRPESRSGQPASHTPAAPGSGPAGFQPLKRDDYMSSAGTRPMTPRGRSSVAINDGSAPAHGRHGRRRVASRDEPRSRPTLAQSRRAHLDAAARQRSATFRPFCAHAQDAAAGTIRDPGRNAGAHEVGGSQRVPTAGRPGRSRRGVPRRPAATRWRGLFARPAPRWPRTRGRHHRAAAGSWPRNAAAGRARDDDRGRR